MKRRQFLKSKIQGILFGVTLGAIGTPFLLGCISEQDAALAASQRTVEKECGWDLIFLHAPKGWSREKTEGMVREMNEKFKDKKQVFVAVALEGSNEIGVLKIRDVTFENVEQIKKEFRKEFFNDNP